MAGISDITHFALFLILDYLLADCERENKNEPLYPIKYDNIFNFAGTCRGLRSIVRSWSRSMYDNLEIDRLLVEPHQYLNVRFEEIHKSLNGATQIKVENYLDIYITAMMKNPLLKTFKLSNKPEFYYSYHDYVFDEIVMAICGQSKRALLYKDRLPKVKEICVDIPGRSITREHLIGLANLHISKLRLTASFAISDLVELCAESPALVTLEINEYSFADHGKLTEIVGHCPALKQLTFVMSDYVRDRDYLKLALLDKLQHLEIRTPPVQEIDFGWDEDHDVKHMAVKRSRMDPDYQVDPPLENATALLLMIKAFAERKKPKLVQLRLMFEVNDETVQAIAQLKGLKMLECGFCHSKSIRHLKEHPTLNRLNIRCRDLIITDNILDLLRKHITVSNYSTKLFLNQRGSLSIITNGKVNFCYDNFEPLLKLENLKTIWVSKDLVLAMQSVVHLFLERSVQIQSPCTIILQQETRHLKMLYDSDYLEEEIPLPMVQNLRSFTVSSLELPSTRFLESLVKHHRDTLQEICIRIPNTIFELPKSHYLSKSAVVALTFLTSLRKVSCGLQKLIYILQLFPLEELEEIEVLSQHDLQYLSLSLVPLLINCSKLSSFKIKVPVSGINQASLMGLQDAVLAYRDPDMQSDLNICLCITESTTAEQNALITSPFKHMKLWTETIDNDYVI